MSINIKNKSSILVNTCDNFEDCWIPFFKLFTIYWPDFNGKIYLNTEYKDFSYPGLDIVCTKVCEVNKVPHSVRATWSQCLSWTLEAIDTDVVLYMQEDYFLKDFVKNDLIEKYVQMMVENNDIDCIHLTDQAVIPNNKSIDYEGLYTVQNNQKYQISCQAALWKKETLQSYLRIYENAWQFEEFGSKRAAVLNHNFYVVDKSWVQLNVFEIIPYVFTGIMQGRWFEEVVPLFEKHNLEVDYTKRGFVKDKPPKPLKNRIKYRLNKFPIWIRHLTDIYQIKSSLNKK
ncbi:hypothetical protein C3L50_12660 [Flavobacterium alvei]|uniref:Glycosyl transferase n=1 Tax=Flavobacterium alvei TaxID=2080416 RepID=A0A2S5A6B4_9FLAO|nr:hypothetical protein [Flavobacterium alvei]POY38118.1 hypothetical protein C3L50_12660 [Flavobacterium alvei]